MQARKQKLKLLKNQKIFIDLGEDLQNFCAVSNVDLENLNLSITTNIKYLLATFFQQIREIRDFLNLQTKCMDPKTNLNNLSDIVCDKDLVVEKKTLKVKTGEADKENTFLRGEVTDLTVL